MHALGRGGARLLRLGQRQDGGVGEARSPLPRAHPEPGLQARSRDSPEAEMTDFGGLAGPGEPGRPKRWESSASTF